MSNSNGTGSSSTLTVIVIATVIVVAIMQMFAGDGGSTTTYAPQPDNSSFEHRYVTERFKQEGFSKSEAQQAADAVIKFHNAQKNR